MKKTLKIFLIVGCIVILSACGQAKLDNGKNAVVSFTEGGISTEDLYNVLKETYGAENIVNLIDKYLLEKKYKVTSDETKYVKQSVASAEEAAKNYNTDFNKYVYYYYGVSSEAAFKDYISLNYKRSLWIEEYGQEVVTDTQINDYYKNESVGDMTLSHILITSSATDKMTDDEKSKAKAEAYNTAKEVIEKLKKGEDFSKLAKEYSKDSETASKGGSLGKINVGDYVTEVFEAAKPLAVGSYTTTPVESTYGYHIVYKTAQDKKPALDDTLKAEIRALIGKEISSETSFYLKAMKALREKNGMKFNDSELEKAYEKYITTSSTTNNQ